MRRGKWVVLLLAAELLSCRREERRFDEVRAMSPAMYRGNAWAMGQGYELYNQMNCVGCHANGGGGMAPPLMDGKWIYGSAPGDVFQTISDGRPNGMPAWKGRLSDQQIWELVAYVRSMSGLAPKDAAPARPDHMAVAPPNNRMKPQPLEKEESH